MDGDALADRRVVSIDQHWRQDAPNGLHWRLAHPEDMPAIHKHWDAQERRIGEQDRPNLFDTPVLIAFALVDDQDAVQGGIYAELTVEMCTFGATRNLSEAIPSLVEPLHGFLYDKKIRVVRALVPKRLARLMEPFLKPWNMRNLSGVFDLFGYLVRR